MRSNDVVTTEEAIGNIRRATHARGNVEKRAKAKTKPLALAEKARRHHHSQSTSVTSRLAFLVVEIVVVD